ncbi:MAG: Hpt domain-containing protein [Deltaproteobacteria bacterium]|nr:Hpt domain-containing protein [Deltaproteobacteria bacterium]
MADTDQIIDMPDFMERVEDDMELAGDLAELFLSDTFPKLDELKNHISQNNPVGVRSVSHSIKGAAANLSALQVCKFSHSLEDMGTSGELTGAQQTLDRLVSAMGDLKAVLSEKFNL